jgi:hypothetical protein
MDLHFNGTKPPRPDSVRARPDTPPTHFVAGGEIPETASVRLDFLATF